MRFLCIATAIFLPYVLFGSAVDACEQHVLAKISQTGRHVGYNSESGEFVSAKHAFFACGEIPSSMRRMLRDRAFDEALTKARLEIAEAMRAHVKGVNSAGRHNTDDGSSKIVETAYATLSHDMLWGFEVIALSESLLDGQYGLALAVVWSKDRETNCIRSLGGEIIAAEDWKEQLKSHVLAFEGCFPLLSSFTDSSGFVHCYALSVIDVSHVPMQLRSVRMKEEESKVLRRLQLWRDGRGASGSRLKASLESRKGRLSRLSRERLGGSCVTFSGSIPECLCVFEGDVPGSQAGRSMHLLVYAIGPSASALLNVDENQSAEASSQTHVSVFNPSTGKYEEVYK